MACGASEGRHGRARERGDGCFTKWAIAMIRQVNVGCEAHAVAHRNHHVSIDVKAVPGLRGGVCVCHCRASLVARRMRLRRRSTPTALICPYFGCNVVVLPSAITEQGTCCDQLR